MSATKILWGQITLVFAIVLITVWASTQWTVWRLGLSTPALATLVRARPGPVLFSPDLLLVVVRLRRLCPAIFVEGACITASGGFLSIGVAIGMSFWRARDAKNTGTYGSARWATAGEARHAGLIDPDGVVLGKPRADY